VPVRQKGEDMAIAIPKNIQEKLGVEGTEELLNFILEEQRKAKEELKKEYIGEDEKRELRLEKKIEEVRGSLDKKIEQTKSELLQSDAKLDKKIEQTKSELLQRIESVRAEIKEGNFNQLKWFFAMWISLIIAMGIFKIF
jgi:tetrahydromethanopterin S-methyltransferase subunit G